MNRRLLLVSITGFWLIMTGLLLDRELGGARFERVAREQDEPIESWLGLYAEDVPVGFVHFQQLPETRHGDQGTALHLVMEMNLEMFSRSIDLAVSGSTWHPRIGLSSPSEIRFDVQSGPYEARFTGTIQNGRLEAEVENAGSVVAIRVPIDDELLLQAGFGGSLTMPVLEVGEKVRMTTFDPITMRTQDIQVRCSAREMLELDGERIPARVLETEASGLSTRVWVDDDGMVIRALTPLRLEMRRITSEQIAAARGPSKDRTAGDGGALLGLSAIHPTGLRPRRGQSSMRFRLRGVETRSVPSQADQVFEDGAWLRRVPISKQGLPQHPGAAHRQHADDRAPPPETLASGVFVQAEHTAIREQLRAILEPSGQGSPPPGEGEPPDPAERRWREARAINEWVFEQIEKEPALGIPSALEVLEHRRGDCNEHTVLFAALARAASIPTKIDIGLVWSEELDGFYYHAWPEVLIAGSWIAMDPTLGQELADATHIKLLEGGIESWPRLLLYMGRLEIDVTEVKP